MPEQTDQPQTYEAAAGRLEEIIERLDSGETEVRETLDLVREGKGLIEFCKGELDSVSGELRELKLDELIASLESTSVDPPSTPDDSA